MSSNLQNAQQLKAEVALMNELNRFYYDPLGYVMFAFPWDTDTSIQQCELTGRWKKRFPNCKYGPDIWACEFLDDLGAEIYHRKFNGSDAVDPIRFATVSGHGIGKSCLTAWLIKFIMDTRDNAKGTVTAAKQDQLKTKTWAELGKWHNLSVTKELYEYSAGRGSMSLKHKRFPATWRCDAQTSKEENSESFAGQHNVSTTSFYIFDEASGIPDKIYEVRDGGLTDGEPMVFDFGNPTKNSGHFYQECQGRLKHLYNVRKIDSRDVKITNKAYLQEIIDTYGEDSDRARVRVKGEFPLGGSLEFIGIQEVKAAQMRPLVGRQPTDPLIIGVDVARYGSDDSVIYPRVGMDARTFPVQRYSGLNTIELAGRVIETVKWFRTYGLEPSAIFIDGGGVGGGVVDYLISLGYANIYEVNFGWRAVDQGTYCRTADQMWGNMKEALANRLCIPLPTDDVGIKLEEQLTAREYDHNRLEQIELETKKQLKERGLDSPDIADALALTFFQDVESPKTEPDHFLLPAGGRELSDFDPIANVSVAA